MYTYANLISEVKANVFPSGEASVLVTAHNKAILDALIDLQTWVECLQQNNTTIIPACDTLYNCGVTGADAPRGRIKKVSVINTMPEGPLGGTTLFDEQFTLSITSAAQPPTSIGQIQNAGAYVISFNVQNTQCGTTGVPILTWDKQTPEYVVGGPQYFNVTVIYIDVTTKKQASVSQILPVSACNQTLFSTVNIAAGSQVYVVIVPVNLPPASATAPVMANITISVQEPASYVAPEKDEWCSEIEYKQTDAHYVKNYFLHARRRGFTGLGTFFNFPCCEWDLRPRPKPALDIGVLPGLPPLPLGFHYNQADTDKRFRAHAGLWAIERQNLFLIPWIQSTEKVVVVWDGIKRQWNQSDPVDQDPNLIKAIIAYVRKDHYTHWERDDRLASDAAAEYNEVRSVLIHECNEETRTRFEGEKSVARAQSTTLSLFYNDSPQTATANCPSGQTGNAVSITIAVGTVSSTVSVADANSLAMQQAQSQAQAQLSCSSQQQKFQNTPQSYTAQCTTTDPNGLVDGPNVTVNIPAGQFTSAISQADANAQALAAAQAQATSQLQCTWLNSPQTYTATCPQGTTGAPVTVTIPQGQFTSTISQADANQQALTAATNQANTQLSCSGGGGTTVYWNTQQLVCQQRAVSNCESNPGVIGPGSVTVCVNVPAHTFSTIVSQAVANQIAYQQGLIYGASVQLPLLPLCNQIFNFNYP